MPFNPLCIIVALTGLYLLFKLRFFFIIHPVRALRLTISSLKRRSTARALFLALSGTLGVGNVLGVAVGIITGGAGSVFWMLLSALFASVLKYSEVVLSQDSSRREDGAKHGGMTYVLRRSFGKMGAPLSLIYSSCVILLSLFMGAALQSAALVSSVDVIFDTPPTLTAVILAFCVLLSVVGGAKIIEKIAAVVIPLTTIIYIFLTLSVVFVCRAHLPAAIESILRGAISAEGAFGGIFGFFFSRAVSEGFARGLLSNEAGAGTSSMAHARTESMNPAQMGLMGIVEVFFDTTLLCTLTALMILTSVGDITAFTTGMPLVLTAVTGALGTPFSFVLALCVAAFAISTVNCWYFYGCEALSSLLGGTPPLYLPVYLAFVILGHTLSEGMLVFVTDLLLLLLTLLTTCVLIKKSDRILHLSESGGVIPRHGKYLNLRIPSGRGLALNKPDKR